MVGCMTGRLAERKKKCLLGGLIDGMMNRSVERVNELIGDCVTDG